MGKTFALEACLWNFCGMNDESKADPDMDTRTLKATAGMTTNPIAIDDGESTKKEAKHVTSAFDRTKYKTKNGTVKNVAVYMITSNIMTRSAICMVLLYVSNVECFITIFSCHGLIVHGSSC